MIKRRTDRENQAPAKGLKPEGFSGLSYSEMFDPAERDLRNGQDYYQEYLKSDLWAFIRKSVMEREDGKCQVCGQPATSIHHMEYKIATMRGLASEVLITLCQEHHEYIEFEGGRKTNLETANDRLEKLACRYEYRFWGVKSDRPRNFYATHKEWRHRLSAIKSVEEARENRKPWMTEARSTFTCNRLPKADVLKKMSKLESEERGVLAIAGFEVLVRAVLELQEENKYLKSEIANLGVQNAAR